MVGCYEFRNKLSIMCPICHDIQTGNNFNSGYIGDDFVVDIKCDTCGTSYKLSFNAEENDLVLVF